ncbi:methyltransferase domain-containing protein [Actinomadura rugatobispora]|uniref:Protein-L-isoaspartate O-methyltransferase n=1 Tax=Actinomadura rugatobispora TaxID=1994 RepID=A0ABW1AIG2_9ACTN|nr:methyltransferase domain-containing protein [Actinomadura rugatobispora]
MTAVDDASLRAARLMERLTSSGQLHDTYVREAFRDVPRHRFVPRIALACPNDREAHVIDRDRDPSAWWDAVYDDAPIVTQLDDGATDVHIGNGDYTSSCSAPSTVASLLELADLERHHRVLEIGTGTGWTAALTSHIVGEGSVVSIEVDGDVAKQAASNLAAAGYAPKLLIGDGATLRPEGGPFDRVHATCAVSCVPYEWIEQTRPGGTVVTPYSPGFGYSHELRLVVKPDGTAVGRFPGFASYMLLRSQRRGAANGREWAEHDITRSTTRIDPRTIAHASAGADLAVFALTGVHTRTEADADGFTLWVLDPDDAGRWTAVNYQPGDDEYEVQQAGNRDLWGEVTSAYFTWVGWGQPDRDRFGMTVTPDGERLWLDRPDDIVGSHR